MEQLFNLSPATHFHVQMDDSQLVSNLKELFFLLNKWNHSGELEADCSEKLAPLALHLCGKQFVEHSDYRVRLMVACCLLNLMSQHFLMSADLVVVLLLIIDQLNLLKQPKTTAFKYAFYVLEQLSDTDFSYILMSLPEKTKNHLCSNILEKCFDVIDAMTEEMDIKVNSMTEQLCEHLVESMLYEGTVPRSCLHAVLIHLLRPPSSSHNLVLRLLRRLEGHVRNDLIKRLNEGPTEESFFVMDKHVFEVIYELHCIDPLMVLGVINTLECPLTAHNDIERKEAMEFLCNFFSKKNSPVATQYKRLWKVFIERILGDKIGQDLILDYISAFLTDHPELQSDLMPVIKKLMCCKLAVRLKLLKSLTHVILNGTASLEQHCALLQLVHNRTYADITIEGRSYALQCLAVVYKKYHYCQPQSNSLLSWILNTIMEHYTCKSASNSERALVKSLLYEHLGSREYSPSDKLEFLHQLWCNMSRKSRIAFHEIGDCDHRIRQFMTEFLRNVSEACENGNTSQVILHISKEVVDNNQLKPICQELFSIFKRDERCRELLHVILSVPSDMERISASQESLLIRINNVSKRSRTMWNILNNLLRRLNVYFISSGCVINFLSNIVSVACSNGEHTQEHLQMSNESLLFLYEVVRAHPYSLYEENGFVLLMSLLYKDCGAYSENVLKIFDALARYKAIGKNFGKYFEEELLPHWFKFVIKGDSRLAKLALHCILKHFGAQIDDNIFGGFSRKLQQLLSKPNKIRAVVGIQLMGQLALFCQSKGASEILASMIHNFQLKEIILSHPDSEDFSGDWCEKSNLPLRTLHKVVAIKTLAIYCTLDEFLSDVEDTLKIFGLIIMKKGDITETEVLSKAETSWLRLSAGCGLLRLCASPAVWNRVSTHHLSSLISLIIDENENVSSIFLKKLAKYLNFEDFPVDLFALFAFGGLEERDEIKKKVETIFYNSVRNRWLRICSLHDSCPDKLGKLSEVIPEASVCALVALLSLRPEADVLPCLHFFWNSMLHHSFSTVRPTEDFYLDFFNKAKKCCNAFDPQNEEINKRMWKICEEAENYLHRKKRKIKASAMTNIQLPKKYFVPFTSTH